MILGAGSDMGSDILESNSKLTYMRYAKNKYIIRSPESTSNFEGDQ